MELMQDSHSGFFSRRSASEINPAFRRLQLGGGSAQRPAPRPNVVRTMARVQGQAAHPAPKPNVVTTPLNKKPHPPNVTSAKKLDHVQSSSSKASSQRKLHTVIPRMNNKVIFSW